MITSLFIAFYNPGAILAKAALILGSMQACLLVILFYSNYLRRNDLYRYLSEAVFFLPAVILL
jgi:hypothetical protein